MELQDRASLVTGSSRGIGRAIALGMGEAGAHVAIHYLRSRDTAQTVAGEIEAFGRRTLVVSGDEADREAVNAIVAEVEQALGPIDILVNNAASFLENVSIWEIIEAQWDRVFDINVKGPLFGMQEVVLSMNARESGVILNISSLGSESVKHGVAAYGSSKVALDTLTSAMALELAPCDIHVVGSAPGHIDTQDNLEWITQDPSRHERFRARIALGWLGKREEIGKIAAFLASEAAGYITGADPCSERCDDVARTHCLIPASRLMSGYRSAALC